MNTQSNTILNKKISTLKKELNDLSSQIEKERDEASEENPSLQELLDKKEILLGELDSLVNPDETVTGEVSAEIGKVYKVTVRGVEKSLKIVIPAEADPSKGLISSLSPIAKALEGRHTGDKVEVKTPAGKTTYKIKRVIK